MPPPVPPPIIPSGPQLQTGTLINPAPLPRSGAPDRGAPPPRLGVPGAAALSAADRRLDRNITDVCKRQPGVLPRMSFSTFGREMLFDGANPVSAQMAERLLTCLCATPLGNNDWQTVTGPCSVRQFRALSADGQLALINRVWNALATAHAFDMPTEQMCDPEYDTPPNNRAPLPSSWCPVSPGAASHHKRLAGRQPWRTLGIGFRVDGADQSAIDRNTSQGFTQQRLTRPFMLGVRGQEIEGTVLMNQAQARVWTGNRDIFNESAVCVSRNFFGATAFPERETDHKGAEGAYVWAVNCAGLWGFDTEGYQVGLGNASQWRPGEKAFASIAVDRVIGYVRIQRRGAPAEGGWRFDVPDDAHWVFTGGRVSVAQRTYMVDELNAWRGRHVIPALFDFATA
jgi:hypothetical protein